MSDRVIPIRRRSGSVFELVGRPMDNGVTWVWTQNDLDMATEARARADLGALFVGADVPRFVLVYLGTERFVDVRGLRLLIETAGQVRCGGGDLVVVAPPWCLERMIEVLDVGDRLPIVATAQQAVQRVRRQVGG
jgi:anti-anti-sigma factor